MSLRIATALMALLTISATPVHACSQPQVETAFDTEAPTASDIVAVRVEALELEAESLPFGQHTIRGKIRVLKHYRGSGDFTELRYVNTQCAGLRMDVGGIYLIATSASAPSIELQSSAAPILQLSGAFPIDPELVVRANPTVERLMLALRGQGSFQITSEPARQGFYRYGPPPRVPHPDEFTDE